MANKNLGSARRAKNDEFYTQYADIEREMNAYLDLNPEVFEGKTVLLPCDDPEWSNFTKYFAQNFSKLGLKKVISTSFAPNSKPREIPYQPTLFELDSPEFDSTKTESNGKIFTLDRDISNDGLIDFKDLKWTYLEGDGDFRSPEIIQLRNEANVVITNPPFSLFREFIGWLVEGNTMFSVIGSTNAIAYRDIFPPIKGNKLWLGNGFHAGNAYFSSPSRREYAEGVLDEGTGLVKFRNVNWFTNIDHGRRHEPLPLMSEADNIKFSKHKEVRGVGYSKYANYDAIEVPFTDAIPSDYEGLMGVPLSFLNKYSPEQFEIVGTSANGLVPDEFKSSDGVSEQFVEDYYRAGGTGAYKAGNPTAGIYRDGVARMVYQRLFIRHKRRSK